MSVAARPARSPRPAWFGPLALALAGCVLVPVAPTATTASAASALSLGPVSTLPTPATPRDLGTTTGTGTRFISETWSVPAQDLYSPDNGKTWQAVPEGFGHDLVSDRIGYGGTFAAMSRSENADGYWVVDGFRRWDPDTGVVSFAPYDLGDLPGGDESEGFMLDDYVGSVGVLNDGRVVTFAGDSVTLTTPAWSTTPELYDLEYALSKDGATAVRAGTISSASTGYLSVAPADGSAGGATVKVTGLLGMDVSAFTIHYLVGTSTKLKVCKALVTSPAKPTCHTVASGDYRPSKIEDAVLSTSAGADQVTVYRHSGATPKWLLTGGRSARVSSSWGWLPFRDTPMPMARAYSKADRLEMASTISAKGVATPLFAGPPQPAWTAYTALSAGRISYARELYSRAKGLYRIVQHRTFDGTSYGAATALTSREVRVVAASAGRTAVQWENTAVNDRTYKVVFYDGTTKTGSFTPTKKRTWLGELSGPYARVANVGVVRIDGKVSSTQPALAIFGSLVVEASAAQPASERTFAVRDLARPGAVAVPLDLPAAAGRTYGNDLRLWGDWVAVQYNVEDGVGGVLVRNYRTGQETDLPGKWASGLGDGWVLLTTMGSDASTPVVRVLTTDASLSLPVADSPEVYGHEASTDGLRTFSWPGGEGGQVVQAQVSGLPASAPRLLGTLASASFAAKGTNTWTPKFDLTKAVATGTLELRDAEGTLVRALTTTANTLGSVRGARWDGRNAAGARVPAGTYTWTLVVAATDGSGTALAVDGQGPPSGTVKVTR